MSPVRNRSAKKRRSRHRYSGIPVLTATTRSLATASPTPQRRKRYDVTETQGNGGMEILRNGAFADSTFHDPNTFPETISTPHDGQEHDLAASTSSHELKISTWQALWGLIATNGSQKFTKCQYQSVRLLADICTTAKVGNEPETECGRVNSMPHYTTLQRTYRPLVTNFLSVRGVTVGAMVDTTKAGARYLPSSSSSVTTANVVVIVPSEYARADMCTAPVWSQFVQNSMHALPPSSGLGDVPVVSPVECVDLWPLIAARSWFYGQAQALHLDACGNGGTEFAEVGDMLQISLIACEQDVLPERLSRCFETDASQPRNRLVHGIILHSWNVHHSIRANDPLFTDCQDRILSDRDRHIANCFNFITYESPSDSINIEIPDLPVPQSMEMGVLDSEVPAPRAQSQRSPEQIQILKARREALKRKRLQMDAAWRNWSKPILKPGDFIVMLRPCSVDECDRPESNLTRPLLTDFDRASRICVVTRFLVENEERARHMFWIDGGTDLHSPPVTPLAEQNGLQQYCSPIFCSGEPSLLCEVREVSVQRTHQGKRGFQRYAPTSSIGTLSNDEPYFIYRFLIFWDGFEIQRGKSASGEGIYLLCLNLPVPARSSPSAIRIISATPPGVSIHDIFKKLIPDIVQGMTAGFSDYDAGGTRRRIFLDLVGFIGDTLAINQILDTLGHNGVACCHLCRFVRRSSTNVGSKYAEKGAHSMISSSLRNFFHHAAVRDSGAKSETCRLLGIKPIIPEATKVVLSLRNAMFEARSGIPTTSDGRPVVPHVLDPYRACLIAPDHLLTSHFRDCVSLVLKLLPTRAYRMECEAFLLSFLKEANLGTQNRLVDHEKKALFSMSMSELYALSVVSHPAFLAGCASMEHKVGDSTVLSSRCREAIDLLGSCTRLIAHLCHSPRYPYKEPFVRFSATAMHLTNLQTLTETHLADVVAICRLADEDFFVLDDSSCSRERKAEAFFKYKEAILAVKAIDKPNLHRLREFVFGTLPMVGNLSRLGELVLEKTHQVLKRSVSQSNNKQIQMQAMRDVMFNDWQGRLTDLINGVLSGSDANNSAMRGCFRLLCGRESLISLQGQPTNNHYESVLKLLGPAGIVSRELRAQSRTVLSPRAQFTDRRLTWTLSDSYPLDKDDGSPTPEMEKLLSCLRASYPTEFNSLTIFVGKTAISTYSNNAAGFRFQRGDVMDFWCYQSSNMAFHRPFLVQVQELPPLDSWASSIGSSLWCVTNFLTLKQPSGRVTLLAALLPCMLDSSTSQYPDIHGFKKYKTVLDSPFSLAKLNDSIRRAVYLHPCIDSKCVPIQNTLSILHGEPHTPLSGNSFLALTCLHGYPPRKG